MKKHTISSFFCALALLAGSQAFAHGDMEHGGGACAGDMKKLCGDVKKGDHEAMMKCMKDNEGKLSDPCKAQREKWKAQKEAMMSACKSDMENFCKDISQDDHKAMHDCMMKNESKLSDSCKAEHAKMKKSHHGHHDGAKGAK